EPALSVVLATHGRRDHPRDGGEPLAEARRARLEHAQERAPREPSPQRSSRASHSASRICGVRLSYGARPPQGPITSQLPRHNGLMDHDRARSILADKHRAVLATYRADGSVQMSPVSVALDGMGRPVISTRQTAYKVKNLRRDPRASLCVFSDAFFGEWVQVDGTVTIVE